MQCQMGEFIIYTQQVSLVVAKSCSTTKSSSADTQAALSRHRCTFINHTSIMPNPNETTDIRCSRDRTATRVSLIRVGTSSIPNSCSWHRRFCPATLRRSRWPSISSRGWLPFRAAAFIWRSVVSFHIRYPPCTEDQFEMCCQSSSRRR